MMNHLSPWFVLLQCKQIHQLFLFWILFNRAAHQGICEHPHIFSINQVTKTKLSYFPQTSLQISF